MAGSLGIEALAYVCTADGFLTSIQEVAPLEDNLHRVAMFNPASNVDQASRLRAVNPSVAADTRAFGAAEIESGGSGLDSALGDGERKWTLTIESDAPVGVMNLLENTRTGHLTNLSSVPTPPGEDGVHPVPLFPALSGESGRQGINRSSRSGTVRIVAYDDAGDRYGPPNLPSGWAKRRISTRRFWNWAMSQRA